MLIRLHDAVENYFLLNKRYYCMQSMDQFISYFLNPKVFTDIEFIKENDDRQASICIYDIQLTDETKLKDNEINLLISIENLTFWGNYQHYNKFGEYNNNKTSIYFYNHIPRIVRTDKYIAIPQIYNFINYYRTNIINLESISFNDKKFCLVINKSNLNSQIYKFCDKINHIGQIDHIASYNNEILDKSCYQSIELLQVLNRYKFIVCFENSINLGYITEKIFNCFYAKTVPIYYGSPIISEYINNNAYLDANNIKQIEELNSDEEKYNRIINEEKISKTYNDENYLDQLNEFIRMKKTC